MAKPSQHQQPRERQARPPSPHAPSEPPLSRDGLGPCKGGTRRRRPGASVRRAQLRQRGQRRPSAAGDGRPPRGARVSRHPAGTCSLEDAPAPARTPQARRPRLPAGGPPPAPHVTVGSSQHQRRRQRSRPDAARLRGHRAARSSTRPLLGSHGRRQDAPRISRGCGAHHIAADEGRDPGSPPTPRAHVGTTRSIRRRSDTPAPAPHAARAAHTSPHAHHTLTYSSAHTRANTPRTLWARPRQHTPAHSHPHPSPAPTHLDSSQVSGGS